MSALAIIDTNELANLDALLGTGSDGGTEYMPSLRINYDDEDAQGNELKKGMFWVKGVDIPVYATSVTFRPLAQFFKWSEYDADKGEYVNQTISVHNMRTEARDEKGTIKCGKPNSKILAADPELALKYKPVKALRMLYGLVSYEGKTATGAATKVENLPVVFQNKGSSFMPFEDEYTKKLPAGRKLYEYALEVTAKREKNGGTVYYTVEYKPNLKTPLPVTKDVFDTMTHILEIVKGENAKIEAKYEAAIRSKQNEDSAVGGVSKFLDLDADDNMDDSIPF